MESDDEDEGSATSATVKLGVGVGVGYLIYRLLSARGGGQGPGLGGGPGAVPGGGPGGGRGNGGGRPGEAPWGSTLSAPRPTQDPGFDPLVSPPSPLPRAHDVVPIEARVRPSPTDPAKTVLEVEGRILSIGDLVARIDAGGRRDVIIAVRGDAQQGGWEEIRDALGFAGIRILLRTPAAAAPVSGR
jgi:hypothetical protein